jgi:hypothetical protein
VELDTHASGAPTSTRDQRTSDAANNFAGSSTAQKQRIRLDAQDPVHQRVRDLNFSAAAIELKHFAQRIKENQEVAWQSKLDRKCELIHCLYCRSVTRRNPSHRFVNLQAV